MNILIVEDDKSLNNGIALSFSSDKIIQACSISEARKVFNAAVELILLDVNLPDGSGLYFCREIRTISKVTMQGKL